jgi:hypothetical protein
MRRCGEAQAARLSGRAVRIAAVGSSMRLGARRCGDGAATCGWRAAAMDTVRMALAWAGGPWARRAAQAESGDADANMGSAALAPCGRDTARGVASVSWRPEDEPVCPAHDVGGHLGMSPCPMGSETRVRILDVAVCAAKDWRPRSVTWSGAPSG